MSKTTDTILRIRAQNLAKKELREVSKDLDGISESQKKNATSAGLAARALRELTTEQANLNTVAKELQKRGSFLGNVEKQKADIAATTAKIEQLREKLAQLSAQKAAGAPIKGLATQIRNTETSIAAANAKLATQQERLAKSAEKAKTLGVAIENSRAHLADINAELVRTEQLAQANVAAQERYAAAVAEAADARRRENEAAKAAAAAADKAAAEQEARTKRQLELDDARVRLAEKRRIAEKRADSIAAFGAMPAPRLAGVDTGVSHGPGNAAGAADAVAAARQAGIAERFNATLQRLNSTQRTTAAGQSRLGNVIRSVTTAMNGENASMDRHNKLGGIFADTGRKSLSVYQRLRGQILSTAAAYIGLYQAVNLVKSAVDVQQQRKAIEIKIKMANQGDIVRTGNDIAFLRKEADRLGLVFEDLAGHYANFKIGARAAGLTQKQTNDTFIKAAEIIRAMSLSTDDADGVFRAFVQIMGKSKVQAEELRGQLGDRLPGAVALFAKSLVDRGLIKNLSDVDKFIKDGKAGMPEFLAFVDKYHSTVKDAVASSSETLYANFARLKNGWRDFLIVLAEAGVANGLNDVVTKLIDKLKGPEGKKAAQELASAFKLVGDALIWVVDHADLFIAALKAILALQAAKAVIGMSSAFLTFAGSLGRTLKGTWEFGKALIAARAGAAGTGLAMRSLSLLLGPVGIALAAVAAMFYKVAAAEAAANERTQQFIDLQKRALNARGLSIVPELADIKADSLAKLSEYNKIQAELNRRRKEEGAILGTVREGARKLDDTLRGADRGESTAALIQRQRALQVQLDANASTALLGKRRLDAYLETQKQLAAQDAAEKPGFTAASTADADAAAKKAADAAAKAAAAAEEARLDAADRSKKALLDIENELASAKLSIGEKSNEDIENDLRLRLANIKNEIETKRTELNNLLREAQAKGSPQGVSDAQAAIGKLDTLEREKVARATLESDILRMEQAEKRVNDLIEKRDQLISTVNAEVESGSKDYLQGQAEIIRVQQELNPLIVKGAQDLVAFVEAHPDVLSGLGVDILLAKMQAVVATASKLTTQTEKIARNLGGQFAQGVAASFGEFAKGIAGAITGANSIADAFKNAKNAFLNFAADFLINIAQMIVQAIILEAIMAALGYGSGANGTADYGAAVSKALTGHTGGVVRSTSIGGTNPTRQVSPALFVNAPRFHDGGLPGLQAGEVPAILKKGEEVLTRDDPRNVLNGGGQQAASMDLSIVNTIDSRSVVEAGLNTRAGRRIVYNIIQADKSAYKRLLT